MGGREARDRDGGTGRDAQPLRKAAAGLLENGLSK